MNDNPFLNVVANLAERAKDAIPEVEGDYIDKEDGLLHCGICKEKKQTRITMFGRELTPHCLCSCGKAQQKKEELEREEGRIYTTYDVFKSKSKSDFELFAWLSDHDISISDRLKAEKAKVIDRLCFGYNDKLRKATFASDDGCNKEVSDSLKAYVEDFPKMKEEGKGLCLFGEVGRGKSFLAACVGNALIDKGIPVLFTSFLDIEAELHSRDADRSAFTKMMNKFPLIIIDDLGVERTTPYMQEVVYSIIDSRDKSGLPLICTTNLSNTELKSPKTMNEKRIYSRLYEMCLFIEVKGNDKRREEAREAYQRHLKIVRGCNDV